MILISISFADYTIVFTHANFFNIKTEKYIYDSTIVITKNGYTINKNIPSKNKITINVGGKYVLPGFFLSYIDAIKYPNLDLWTYSGITGAFSYSNSSYLLSRISSKDPSTLIGENLYTSNYKQNACDLLFSDLIFNKKNLTEESIQYSIYLKDPKTIVVFPEALKYLPKIVKIAHSQGISVICKIKTLEDFKIATKNKVDMILGIPTNKIDFRFSSNIGIISNLSLIRKKYGKESKEYETAISNLKIIVENHNKILIGSFEKIGLPINEIDELSKVLSTKNIILGLTKYAYGFFGYINHKDLLLFDKDPLKNIENIKSLILVVKNGNIANILQGSINYSEKENIKMFENVNSSYLWGYSSIYPILSIEKKQVGFGNEIYFPRISTDIHCGIFLANDYSLGYKFGLSYKNLSYDYLYTVNQYENRSLTLELKKEKFGYYGEYVLKNPFNYPKYDSGLFENIFYKSNNMYLLLGMDRATRKMYWKMQFKMEKHKKEYVDFFFGLSNSDFYQYKINMGNLNFFNNFEDTGNLLISLNIEKRVPLLNGLAYIPIGGNIYIKDKEMNMYTYGGIDTSNGIALLLMYDLNNKFKVMLRFANESFK